MREVMETENGAVWYVEDGGYFWIRFGNIRWRMDADALAPYCGYLRSVGRFLSGEGERPEPAYLRTRDPAIHLAFRLPELRELLFLLDVAEAVHAIESSPTHPLPPDPEKP